jgi:hypothetical protein
MYLMGKPPMALTKAGNNTLNRIGNRYHGPETMPRRCQIPSAVFRFLRSVRLLRGTGADKFKLKSCLFAVNWFLIKAMARMRVRAT